MDVGEDESGDGLYCGFEGLVSSGGSNECFWEGFSWGEVAEGGSGRSPEFFRDCCEVGLMLGDVSAFG